MRNLKLILLAVAVTVLSAACGRPETIVDFEPGNPGGWTAETADFPEALLVTGTEADGHVGSGYLASGSEPLTLVSPSFTIRKPFINLLLAGAKGGMMMATGSSVKLLVGDEPVRTASSISTDPTKFEWVSWDVTEFKGAEARLCIQVPEPRSFGNRTFPPAELLVDRIEQNTRMLSDYMEEYRETLVAKDKYVLIPAANDGTGSRLSVLVDGENILGLPQSVRAAAGNVDFFIPVDISAYSGKKVDVVLTGVKKSDAVYKGIRQSETMEIEDEPYRPVYHFAPLFGWTNDPNGLVFKDGEWHLSYQANPYGTNHGNMHWGHAVSKDLVHWEQLPAVIAPDDLGSVFSGSAVVDEANTAGFGADAIVAIYTSAGRGGQRQSIAYSLDNGRTYTKYEGNPVLSDPDQRDFRDPKVSWIGNQWVMALATGQTISFYGSKDLKEWEFLSRFGEGIGSHEGVWECPDLLRFQVGGRDKWVLFVSINPGGPWGGSITQYFIGDFDGRNFKADKLPYPLWVDPGIDNYAGVTFSNTGDRHVFLGWMSNWQYTGQTPTRYFRNSMTIPRDLSIKNNGRHLILASVPSPEILAARGDARVLSGLADVPEGTVGPLLEDNTGAYEVEMTVRPKGNVPFRFSLENGKGEHVDFTVDPKAGQLRFERGASGLTDFSPSYNTGPIAVDLPARPEYKVRLFVDRLSTELFVNDGDLVFTNCVFPAEPFNGLSFRAENGTLSVSDINVYPIR